VEELDGLPLALSTAGAYLRRVAIGFDGYLRLYKESWATLHASTPSLGSYKDRTLCSTWQLSYEQVKKQNPLAANLLRWWAYFDNEDIWFELLQPLGVDDWETETNDSNSTLQDREDAEVPQPLAWTHELADELKFNSAMGILHDYGFIELHTMTPDLPGSRGYSIHSCIHAWTIHVVNKDWDMDLAKLAAAHVATLIPSRDESQFWLLQKRLLSHAIQSCTTIPYNDENVTWVFFKLGYLYISQGKLQEAEDMFRKALRGYDENHGPDYTWTLHTFSNLGSLYLDQGKLQEAEDMFQRALRGYDKSLGPDHMVTLNAINNLGKLYLNQGKLQEAEDMFQQALQGVERAYEPDHELRLHIFNSLGNLCNKQGKLQEAEDMYQWALRGYEEMHGPQLVTRYKPALNVTCGLGQLLRSQGRLVEARVYFQRAHKGFEELFGPSHGRVRELQDILLDLGDAA
jgi:tetratricopeptide (TPR) repeat protein